MSEQPKLSAAELDAYLDTEMGREHMDRRIEERRAVRDGNVGRQCQMRAHITAEHDSLGLLDISAHDWDALTGFNPDMKRDLLSGRCEITDALYEKFIPACKEAARLWPDISPRLDEYGSMCAHAYAAASVQETHGCPHRILPYGTGFTTKEKVAWIRTPPTEAMGDE